ncbi:hypothetical protein DPMN_048128, partial [Dreissena polymorpha]
MEICYNNNSDKTNNAINNFYNQYYYSNINNTYFDASITSPTTTTSSPTTNIYKFTNNYFNFRNYYRTNICTNITKMSRVLRDTTDLRIADVHVNTYYPIRQCTSLNINAHKDSDMSIRFLLRCLLWSPMIACNVIGLFILLMHGYATAEYLSRPRNVSSPQYKKKDEKAERNMINIDYYLVTFLLQFTANPSQHAVGPS